jgi:hypothetical protein
MMRHFYKMCTVSQISLLFAHTLILITFSTLLIYTPYEYRITLFKIGVYFASSLIQKRNYVMKPFHLVIPLCVVQSRV